MHALFPEDYRRSARMIVQDFLFIGTLLVLTLVGGALLYTLS